MIPKIIHYIWLGGKPLPKIAKKCIKSWKKYCPDYEIKRWDETNLDLDCCAYVREAYDAKKYAFASDFFRFEILYKEGGVYLDIDVELIKNIDRFLSNKAFTGLEYGNTMAPGLIFGAEKGNEDLANLVDMYSKIHFVNNDGSLNLTTICEFSTNYYEQFGLKRENRTQTIKNLTVYNVEYFCPIDYRTNKKHITENTYSIHWYKASWYSSKQKIKREIKRILNFLSFGLFGRALDKIRKKRKSK